MAHGLVVPKKYDPENIKELLRQHIPTEDGMCKGEGCGGRVVRRALYLSLHGIGYGLPECEKCGRQYIGGHDAPCVGAQEFMRELNSMTITI